ncbi:MAG: SUMF1/EgtB/PvdO family nonheme iron enzyme [Opitutales bacterium]
MIANYYLVEHVRDLHEATVAVLHQRAWGSPELTERLDQLRKTTHQMEQEGIPRIKEQEEINGRICLFMDPVGGQSLTQYFAEQGGAGSGLGAEATLRLLSQMLTLVGYMHSKGLDHRDMDSELIRIREEGSLCVLGVGLKAALGVDLFEQVVSASVCPLAGDQPSDHLNSFDVMSPEYKSGIEEDSRVDLYGVGVLGYWLLTGQKPDRKNYKAPSSLIEGLPAYWDAFFEKMLQRNRDQRYQSCRSALLALRDMDETPPAPAKKISVESQIGRIPVPKGVRERGKLAIRMYRLAMIGLIGVPLVALAAHFMLSVLIDGEAQGVEVAERVAGEQTPQLELEVIPAAAKVEFAGFEKTFITQSGQLALSVAPGEYELRVSAPGHIGQKKKIVINEDRDFTRKLAFRLEEDRLRLRLRSEPSARFFLVDSQDGEIELGRAGEDGLFELDQASPPGEFEIVARKIGYEPARLDSGAIADAISSGGDEGADAVSVLDLDLTPLPATIQINTEPSGARIGLNGERIGASPLTIIELEPRDEAVVTAELEGFRPREKRLRIKPGMEHLVDFDALVPRSGVLEVALRFDGVDPESSDQLREKTVIRVGEAAYPLESGIIQAVPEGRYTVRAEHPLYVSKPREVVLRDGEEKSMRFRLQPRPGMVHLDFPDGLKPEVSANGRSVEIQDGQIRLPANESQRLEVRIRDHLTLVRQFRLEPTESIRWRIDPVRIQPPQEGQDWTVPYVGIRIAWVPPGEFQMGSPLPEQGRVPNEGPLTSVSFSQGFWSGVFEVTQAQYEWVMGENPSKYVGSKRPVESLSWDQAVAFCSRLTAIEREAGRLPDAYVYRLPTEPEWAYAARAGTETPFHFGDKADATKGNFLGVYPRDFEDGVRQKESFGTKPVGEYTPNAFGLYDLHGNVREWTKDAYAARLPGGQLSDPAPRKGRDRIAVRGGGWVDAAVRARSAAREDVRRETSSDALGFRVFLAPAK